jgi:hypothetical protein
VREPDDLDAAQEMIDDTLAVACEFLHPREDLRRVEAEFLDSLLCADAAAWSRAEAEGKRLAELHHRLGALWGQASESVRARDLDRLGETTAAIRYVAEREFRRSERGDAQRDDG